MTTDGYLRLFRNPELRALWTGSALGVAAARTYLASGGTEGHELNGVHMLVLATTGRRTGRPRPTCLIYGTAGDDLVVVASKAGDDENPDWFKNLQADPSAGVQVGPRRFTRPRPHRVSGRAGRTVADDGAHLPAVRRVCAQDRPADPGCAADASRLRHRPRRHPDQPRSAANTRKHEKEN